MQLSGVSLDLVSRRENVIFDAKWLCHQMDVLGLLKACAVVIRQQTVNVVEDKLFKVAVVQNISGAASLELVNLSLARHYDDNTDVLERVAVHKALLDEERKSNNVLYLLWRDVLALR